MKIGILLGRGTEGCGVTQCAIQMQIVTGATILSCVDKKWPRGKKIEFPGGFQDDDRVYVRQDQALPMTVLALFPRLNTFDI